MTNTIETSAGLSLAISRGGPADGPLVAMLHGGGQTRHSWRRTAKTLEASGYSTLRFDARGHGDSSWAPDADYGASVQAQDLASVLDGVDATRTVLVGASMGGITSLFHAATAPRPPKAIVLVDIVLRAARASGDKLFEFMAGSAEGFASVAEAAERFDSFYPGRQASDDLSGLARSLRIGPDGRYRWHWDPSLFGKPGAQKPPDFESLIGTIAHAIMSPVLLIRGGRSEVVDDAGVAHLRSIVPQLEERTVPGVGHMMVGEDNVAFEAALLPFLHAVLPPTPA